MELKELIERAEKAVGSQKELALKIGQSESNIRAAKAKTTFPIKACFFSLISRGIRFTRAFRGLSKVKAMGTAKAGADS